jgi:hypothetical protein
MAAPRPRGRLDPVRARPPRRFPPFLSCAPSVQPSCPNPTNTTNSTAQKENRTFGIHRRNSASVARTHQAQRNSHAWCSSGVSLVRSLPGSVSAQSFFAPPTVVFAPRSVDFFGQVDPHPPTAGLLLAKLVEALSGREVANLGGPQENPRNVRLRAPPRISAGQARLGKERMGPPRGRTPRMRHPVLT